MKKLLLLAFVLVFVLASCKDNKKKNSTTENAVAQAELSEETMENDSLGEVEKDSLGEVEKENIIDSTKSVIKLFENAAENVGKLVCVQGEVSHVCAHTGLRLFLESENGKLTLEVTTGGDIKIFDQSLADEVIEVEGTLMEKKLSVKEIDGFEKELESKNEAEGHCSTEKENIVKMRTWMKENNKDYYSIYFVKAKSYKILN